MPVWTEETVEMFRKAAQEAIDYGVLLRDAMDLAESLEDRVDSLVAKISRIGGVLVDVLEWADAQDPELRPDWVEKLTAAVEDEC